MTWHSFSEYILERSDINCSRSTFASSKYIFSLFATISGTPGFETIGGSLPSFPTIGATTLLSGNLPSSSTIPLTGPLLSITRPSFVSITGVGSTGLLPSHDLKSHDNKNSKSNRSNNHNSHFKHPLPVNQAQRRLYQGNSFSYWAVNVVSPFKV